MPRSTKTWTTGAGPTIAFIGGAENLVPGTGNLFFERVFVRVCDLAAGMNYGYPMKSPGGCLPHLAVTGTPSATQGVGHTLRLAAQPTLDCTDTFELDFNAWIASGADSKLTAGTAVYAQAWVRDPNHPAGALLSDAAAFVVAPWSSWPRALSAAARARPSPPPCPGP